MFLTRYARWLHTGWPAGAVEKLPEVRDDGTTRIAGVRVVGDLTGIPLLKMAADSGARAVAAFAAEPDFAPGANGVVDVAIVGGGVSGIAAALECRARGIGFVVFEAGQAFATIRDFPAHKPIFTFPTDMDPGALRLTATVKEALVDELESQRRAAGIEPIAARVDRVEKKGKELLVHVAGGEPVRAQRVLIAIGRSGDYRRLGVPGETLDKVTHRLFDAADHAGKRALVVGGGDSAVETAIALAAAGADVTLCHRGQLTRPKPENLARLQSSSVRVQLDSRVKDISDGSVELDTGRIPNDIVFAMIGRDAPLDFFRRSGIPIRGEWRWSSYVGFGLFFALCCLVYNWKGGTALNQTFKDHHWFPFNVPAVGESAFAKTLTDVVRDPGFYYSTAYCVAIVLFGIKRIRRRQTPYVTRQTLTLMAVQIIPLFLLPYFVLPWLGHAGAFSHGVGKTVGDNLFPDGSYWRSFGFILAWPLFLWNVFNWKPLAWWLVIGLVQTFVIIPLIVRRWGKGAYCGWICSCGALAETVGDTQRHKMPHGRAYNRLNMVGQVILAVAMLLFVARAISWSWPKSAIGHALGHAYDLVFYSHMPWDYYHVVDLFLAGVVGVACYFWLSGRVWCRFACPLAALMHIYARFSRFRIFADKKKCISCNVCTTVCHQGIDVMNFAQRGAPMEDPQCVRCSACVSSCPTGVLSFGRLAADGSAILDAVPASLVQMREGKLKLRLVS